MKNLITEEEFKKLHQNEFVQDKEYEHYYKLWVEYRRQTYHLPYSQNRKAYKIYREVFGDLPKNRAYGRAKEDSLKDYDRRNKCSGN